MTPPVRRVANILGDDDIASGESAEAFVALSVCMPTDVSEDGEDGPGSSSE